TRSNSMANGPADGAPDNQLAPRNGWDLGSSVNMGNPSVAGAGTFQVATFTLTVPANAPIESTYEIRTFDYPGFGIDGVMPTRQADILVRVIPEPATALLLLLGAAFGVCGAF